jgi:hypothetical protein
MGAAFRCASCRAWTVRDHRQSAALGFARVAERHDADAALAAVTRATVEAQLGSPRVLEAHSAWVPFLAREGALHTVLRTASVSREATWSGLVGIPIGEEAELPLEVIEPAVALPALAAEEVPPSTSLAEFDERVRIKLGELVRRQAVSSELVPTDIDLHPVWGPRVALVSVPIRVIRFALDPPRSFFERVRGSVTGSYLARVGLHDGRVKTIDLPQIESFGGTVLAVTAVAFLVVLVLLAALIALVSLVFLP